MYVRLKLYTYAFRMVFEESMYEVTKFIDWEPMKEVANLTPNKVYVHEHHYISLYIYTQIIDVCLPRLNPDYVRIAVTQFAA